MSTMASHFSVSGDYTVHLDDNLHKDAPLLRYMDFNKFKLFLRNGLRLARADVFVKDDPFEGEYTEQVYAISRQVYKEDNGIRTYVSETLKKEVERIRKHAFVSSWALGGSESVAMWRLYGKSDDSVAIKTTVGQIMNEIGYALQKQVTEPANLAKFMKKQIVKVSYIDHRTNDAAKEFLKIDDGKILHYKNVGYRHEEEIRILFDASEQGRGGIAEKTGDACIIPIRQEKLIQEILVSPFACDCFFKSVQDEMERCNLAELVKWSDLKFVPGAEVNTPPAKLRRRVGK